MQSLFAPEQGWRGLIGMSPKLRRRRFRDWAAIALMGAVSGLLTHGILGNDTLPPRDLVPMFALACSTMGTLGLLLRWRWARVFGLAQAVAVVSLLAPAVLIAPAEVKAPAGLALGLAFALGATLVGRSQIEAYEGRPSQPNPWTAARMAPVRWALIVNLAAVVFGTGIILQGPRCGCFCDAWFELSSPAAWAVVVAECARLAALLLIAAQRTSGLVLTCAAATLSPLLFGLAMDMWGPGASEPVSLADLVLAVPGILTSWIALAVWVRPMVRFLRTGESARLPD